MELESPLNAGKRRGKSVTGEGQGALGTGRQPMEIFHGNQNESQANSFILFVVFKD